MPLYQRFQNSIPKKATCFVLMPFNDEFKAVFQSIAKGLQKIGVSVKRADQNPQPNIMKNILTGIRDAEYVIVDITGFRPNVMYELGIVHSVKQEDNIIVISRDTGDNAVPFNITYQNINYYVDEPESRRRLISRIKSIIIDDRRNNITNQLPIKIWLKNYGFDKPMPKVELGFSLTGYEGDRCHYDLIFLEYIVAENSVKLKYCVRKKTIVPRTQTILGDFHAFFILNSLSRNLQHISGSLKFVEMDGDDAVLEFQKLD
jgi:hypothetical protein